MIKLVEELGITQVSLVGSTIITSFNMRFICFYYYKDQENIIELRETNHIYIFLYYFDVVCMHYDPKCIKNKHKCSDICISFSCKTSNPFVCQSCNNGHKLQTCQVIPYKKLVKQFHKIQGLYTNQILKYEQRVENTFSQLMTGLRNEFVKFRQEFQYLNINEKIYKVYDQIKKNKQNQLNAQTIFFALKTKPRVAVGLRIKNELQMRMLKQGIFQVYTEVIQKLPPYYSLKNIEQASLDGYDEKNVVGDIQKKYVNKRRNQAGLLSDHFNYLEEMMKKEIYNIHLLYRATENNFSARQFHKKCDGMTNTVMVAKTEFDKIVIGYCPFPWQSPNSWVYKEDNKDQCFLLSVSKDLRGRKFTPFKTKFAIGMHKDYGPSFGDDFVVYDKAHNSKNCWSNFPDVYTCKSKPIEHGGKTIQSFIGVKDHFQKFNLKEWQVYKLSYGKEEQLDNTYIKMYQDIK